MNFPLFQSTKTLFSGLLAVLALSTLSCQNAAENAAETEEPQTEAVAVADTTQARPAPDFYVIPPDMLRDRVWVCDDGSSDLFHVKNDCPVLLECKGKGTFRNVSLQRAIEEYGRYNCQTCSQDLDHIFDDEMVR